jgi:hypothetical protein
MFVLLVVWVTDIGGYFAGRGIGGPKLWPRVSPKKTWAGAIGGFVASLASRRICRVRSRQNRALLLLLGGVLSIASQLGDLFESAVKRRSASRIPARSFPGHGGLLDRLDGFVAAVVWRRFSGFLRGGGWRRPRSYGLVKDMSAVPLRNNKAAASAVRAVTVLGATGSIGDSTMDLLRARATAIRSRR